MQGMLWNEAKLYLLLCMFCTSVRVLKTGKCMCMMY